jgi:Fe-S cluster assembly protein SufD
MAAAIFYIRSRGVSEKDARVMLIHAFASEVISAVKIQALKDNLEECLLEKLGLERQEG